MANLMFDFEISQRAIKRGKTLLYNHADALILIELCKTNNIHILGIDSFVVTDNQTIPQTEYSFDASEKSVLESYEISLAFLNENKNKNFLYEIVY